VRRLVFDTNIYIDWINDGAHEDLLLQRDAVKYLSSVVVMELRAGAFRARDARIVDQLEHAFSRANRLLTPSRAAWSQAGQVLCRLQEQRGYNLGGRRAIAHDVLLAVSARAIGAFVVTQDGRDFRAIASVYAFNLIVVHDPAVGGD
jgi:hypothetical protein